MIKISDLNHHDLNQPTLNTSPTPVTELYKVYHRASQD